MNKKAFTLAETLIVLGTIAIVLIVYQPGMYHGLHEAMEENIFIEKLSQNLSYAQQRAILQNISVNVSMSKSSQSIIFQDLSQSPYRIIQLPHHLYLTHSFTIQYMKTGRIGSYEPIRFVDIEGQEQFQFTIQLGSGQFEVKR